MSDNANTNPFKQLAFDQVKQLAGPHKNWPGRLVYRGEPIFDRDIDLGNLRAKAATYGWELEVFMGRLYLVGPRPVRLAQVAVETKTVTVKRTMKLTGTLLRQLLDRAGLSIPDDASITIQVPGGGDWSNCDLDLDDTSIQITWTEEANETQTNYLTLPL